MRRNTTITLYKTRRIDATYQNIWAFGNAEERNAWLTSKDSIMFTDCKYWKYGEPIKVEIPFTDSFDYDTFWDWCRKMSNDNYVFVSEYNAPDDFECIWSKGVTTSLKVHEHENRTEKLFRYKG